MKKLILVLWVFAVPVIAFGQDKQTMKLKVYFGNEKFNPNQETCSKVYPVTRTTPKTKAMATATLEELFKGVTVQEKAQGYYSFSPGETKSILKSIKVKNNAAYLNFSGLVYAQLGKATTSCGGSWFFSSVEKTLKQFPTIKKVFYAIENSPKDFYEWVQAGERPKELRNCSNKDFR